MLKSTGNISADGCVVPPDSSSGPSLTSSLLHLKAEAALDHSVSLRRCVSVSYKLGRPQRSPLQLDYRRRLLHKHFHCPPLDCCKGVVTVNCSQGWFICSREAPEASTDEGDHMHRLRHTGQTANTYSGGNSLKSPVAMEWERQTHTHTCRVNEAFQYASLP